jgi:hypothetical protein
MANNSKSGGDIEQNKIMIVDDNVFNLSTLHTMIKIKFNINSKTNCGGTEALATFENRIK